MMRKMGIALLFFSTSVAAASAEAWADGASMGASGRAVFQASAVSGKAERPLSWRHRAVQLQIGGAVALAEPALRAVVPVSQPVRKVPGATYARQANPAATASIARDQNGVTGFDVGNKPVLAYPVNASLTLGLGYRYVKGEDLVVRTVDPGSLSPDYDSHNVLLRARWRF
jgi:hypothetical protein